jgi:multiple sugar transport system ATP-binding protein
VVQPRVTTFMAEVEVRHLRKAFAGTVAVDGVDLQVRDGEYLVLLGPSGCGKTTLLRTVAGLEQPNAGDILIGGRVVTTLPPRARKVAMVFQSYALYPHKTVRRNIAFPLQAQGMPKADREAKIEWAAQLLGIEPLLDRKPRQLSGGERQRVALARALVREPDVFLLDEPLSNLDAKLRASARLELKGFQQRVGTTTVYVTHDQVEAMGLGDRIAVLDHGRVQQIGTPDVIYGQPATTFVATFIGMPPMNLIRRRDVWIGFRPEHLIPQPDATTGSDGLLIEGTVMRIENLGPDRHVHLVVPDDDGEAKVISKLPVEVDVQGELNGTMRFVVPERHLHFFDTLTGRRTAAPDRMLA